MLKNPPAVQETLVRKISGRRAWQSTPVFLPRESLANCSPWGGSESDRTEMYLTLGSGLPNGF